MNKSITLFSLLSLAATATNSIAIKHAYMVMSKDKTAYYISELTHHAISFSSEGYLLINGYHIFDDANEKIVDNFPAIKKVTLKSLNPDLIEGTYNTETNKKQKFFISTTFDTKNNRAAYPWEKKYRLLLDYDEVVTK